MTGRELHWKSAGRDIVVNITESPGHGVLRVGDQTIPFELHIADTTGGWIEIAGRNQRFYIHRNRDESRKIVSRYLRGADPEVLELNRHAMSMMRAEVALEIVPGASHLFHEPGALEAVARLAADWFTSHLIPRGEPA